jgi:tetratricopeptide (TPR) repeat protein
MRLVTFALLIGLTGCLNSQRNDSVSAANEGSKAYGQKQWDTAIERYTKAVERWRDNHSAWYGLSAAYAQKKDWAKAADAAKNAVELEPETAMYHLMYGWFLYEKAIQTAKEDQARRESKKVEDVEVDLTNVNFENSKQHLESAIKLNADLWRAHYLLGSIYRHGGKTKEAADEFSKSLQLGAIEPAPWIALAELYRAWDYSDQAIKVAEEGVKVIPGDNEKSEIWFEVGMGYDDKRVDDKAIEAFDKALEARRDNHKAKFARGQAYYRKGEYTKAKRDLEEFSKSGGASVEFFKQQASRMLMDIAAKSAGQTGGTPGQKQSPQDIVDKSKGGKAGEKPDGKKPKGK